MQIQISDDGTDGNDIYLSEYTGGKDSLFAFCPNTDGTYAILTAASEKRSCMDVFGISKESGANICQWNYWGGDGQKYIVEPAAVQKGDVNINGYVDNVDAELLLRYLCGIEKLSAKNLAKAYVTDDADINILDVQAVLDR